MAIKVQCLIYYIKPICLLLCQSLISILQMTKLLLLLLLLSSSSSSSSLKGVLNYLTDHRFLVDIAKAPLTLKQSTLALLFVHGPVLCLTTRSSQSAGPPSILASWTVFDLRRFGVLESKFCFQVNDTDGECR